MHEQQQLAARIATMNGGRGGGEQGAAKRLPGERGGATLERLLGGLGSHSGGAGGRAGGGLPDPLDDISDASTSLVSPVAEGGASGRRLSSPHSSSSSSFTSSSLDGPRAIRRGGAEEEAMLAAGLGLGEGGSPGGGPFPWSAARQELRDKGAAERSGARGSGRGRPAVGRGASSQSRPVQG